VRHTKAIISMDYKELLLKRHEVLKVTRNYFHENGFIEVQTPLLVTNPGLEPHLDYFKTEYLPSMDKTLKSKTLYLPTSPEYHLKKALGKSGLEKIFEITKSFRNGETSKEHQPEFLILEWYRAPGTYKEIANDTEKLINNLSDKTVDRVDYSVEELFLKNCDIKLSELQKAPDFEEKFFEIFF